MACLCSIPMVSAFAAALLCCAEPSGRHPAWPSSPRSFQVLAVFAVLEAGSNRVYSVYIRLQVCTFCMLQRIQETTILNSQPRFSPSHVTQRQPACSPTYLPEVIFLCITGAFQPSIHALAWPLALAVCFSRSAVAWSQRLDVAEPGPPASHAVAAARPGPVGARPERPERSKLRQKGVEKSSWAKVLG